MCWGVSDREKVNGTRAGPDGDVRRYIIIVDVELRCDFDDGAVRFRNIRTSISTR